MLTCVLRLFLVTCNFKIRHAGELLSRPFEFRPGRSESLSWSFELRSWF